MCDFKEKYGDSFATVIDFMKKHYGANSDEDWETLSRSVSPFEADIEVALVVAVLSEIERVYEAGLVGDYKMTADRRARDVDEKYRPMFVRVYRFAQTCYRADLDSKADIEAVKAGYEYAKTYSPFEVEMAQGCYKIFFEDRPVPGEVACQQ